MNVHISPYSHTDYTRHDERRQRKLLLHRHEILKLTGTVVEKGLTLVPLRMYFKNGRRESGARPCQRKAGARQARDDPAARGRPRDARGGEGEPAIVTL
jgi:SsrA-binding protein